MSQANRSVPGAIGMFLNPAAQCRIDFRHACGSLFGRLYLADSVEHANTLSARQQLALVVIDLEQFDRVRDRAALGAVIRARAGLPVLLICPFNRIGWLTDLMPYGPLEYLVGPVLDDSLHLAIARLLESAESAPMMFSIDTAGAITDANPAWCAVAGYLADDVIGADLHTLLVVERPADLAERLERIDECGSARNLQCKLRRADGSLLDVVAHASAVRGGSAAVRFELYALNEFVSSTQRLRQLLAREQVLAELLGLRERLQRAMFEADDSATMGEHLCRTLCTYPGVVHAAVFGLKEHGKVSLDAQHSPHGLDLRELLARGEGLMLTPLGETFPGLVAAHTGEMAWLDAPEKAVEPELAISLSDEAVAMVLGVPLQVGQGGASLGALCLMFGRRSALSADELAGFGAIAQLAAFGLRSASLGRENESLLGQMSHLSNIDALTGLDNRRRGTELLEHEIARARRYRLPLSVITFDIDHFQAINDQFGHACGDQALRAVARLVHQGMRATDHLVRNGGAEFFVIVPHTGAAAALHLAEKIRASVECTAMPGCAHLTISLGVAQLAEQEQGTALLRRLGSALSRAKGAGRNCVELASQ